ncbi:MAG: hypothetical protein IPJ07_01775 [Acidobacteria bacterium]|nr:hypothetical protein [Acidobacteriota bacterium]
MTRVPVAQSPCQSTSQEDRWVGFPARKRLRTHVLKVLINARAEGPGAAGTYREEFRKTFNVDLERSIATGALVLSGESHSRVTRTLKTRKIPPTINSPLERP